VSLESGVWSWTRVLEYRLHGGWLARCSDLIIAGIIFLGSDVEAVGEILREQV
jgi:hypothetical protein